MLPSPTASDPADDSVRGGKRTSRIPATGPATARATMNGIVAIDREDRPVAEDELEVDRQLEERRGLRVAEDESDEQGDATGRRWTPSDGLAAAARTPLEDRPARDQDDTREHEVESQRIGALARNPMMPAGEQDDPERPDGGDQTSARARGRDVAGRASAAG